MKSKDRNHQAGNWVNSYNNVMYVYVSKSDGAKYIGILIIYSEYAWYYAYGAISTSHTYVYHFIIII